MLALSPATIVARRGGPRVHPLRVVGEEGRREKRKKRTVKRDDTDKDKSLKIKSD